MTMYSDRRGCFGRFFPGASRAQCSSRLIHGFAIGQPAVDAYDPEPRIRWIGTRALRIGDVVTGGRLRAAAQRDDQHHDHDDQRKRTAPTATALDRERRAGGTRDSMRGVGNPSADGRRLGPGPVLNSTSPYRTLPAVVN